MTLGQLVTAAAVLAHYASASNPRNTQAVVSPWSVIACLLPGGGHYEDWFLSSAFRFLFLLCFCFCLVRVLQITVAAAASPQQAAVASVIVFVVFALVMFGPSSYLMQIFA